MQKFKCYEAAEAARLAAELQWPGIWCDQCNVTPLTGPRFMKQLENDTYDLCHGCFAGLCESEQTEFKPVEPEIEAVVEPEIEAVVEPEIEVATVEAELQWPGIWCDQCNVTPLTGPRFMKQLENDTYDLCHGCFAGLCESEQTEFKPVQTEAEAEATRTAYQEEVAAKEAEALRIAAEEAEALRIAAEEAEALRIAAEAAALSAAEEQFPLEWQGSVDALIQMGFAQSVAQDTVSSAQ